MNNTTERLAARRYGAAYDRLNRSAQEAAERASAMEEATRLLEQVQMQMKDPSVTCAQKKAWVHDLLKDSPDACALITVLLDAKRYNLLPAVAEEVRALADRRCGFIRAQVWSARPLPAEEQQRVEQVLSRRYGGTAKVQFYTDEQLVGGLKILCQGELIDGTLQGQLQRLAQNLMK